MDESEFWRGLKALAKAEAERFRGAGRGHLPNEAAQRCLLLGLRLASERPDVLAALRAMDAPGRERSEASAAAIEWTQQSIAWAFDEPEGGM